jgi:hypothetical protein
MHKIYKIILKYAVILLCLSNSSNINAQNVIGQIWECSTVNPENLKGLSIIAEANVDTSPKVVKNVSITNNSKLLLDAVFKTTVNGPFEVELGSELEIK